MTVHEMRLRDEPFDSILNGKKNFEIRLLDEKRRAIQAGDRIVFSRMSDTDDELTVEAVGLIMAKSFVELFTLVDPSKAGWPVGTTPERAANDMAAYYSPEERAKFGTVGIEIAKIQSNKLPSP